jgi:hypothetical protein
VVTRLLEFLRSQADEVEQCVSAFAAGHYLCWRRYLLQRLLLPVAALCRGRTQSIWRRMDCSPRKT